MKIRFAGEPIEAACIKLYEDRHKLNIVSDPPVFSHPFSVSGLAGCLLILPSELTHAVWLAACISAPAVAASLKQKKTRHAWSFTSRQRFVTQACHTV